MSRVMLEEKNYEVFIPKGKKENNLFFDFLIRKADEICIKINPNLDDIEEFKESMWSQLTDSIIEIKYEQSASDFNDEKSFLIYFKMDYRIIDFLKTRKDIFDFYDCDKKTGITLEDPAFIKSNKIFCYTITHEKCCVMEESMYKDWMSVLKNKRKL